MKLTFLKKLLPAPNGCGPEGLQHLVPNFMFKRACDLHDNLFSAKAGYFGSNKSFYNRMRHYIKINKAHFGYEIVAFIYFLAVTVFGFPFYFEWKKKIINLFAKYFNIKEWSK